MTYYLACKVNCARIWPHFVDTFSFRGDLFEQNLVSVLEGGRTYVIISEEDLTIVDAMRVCVLTSRFYNVGGKNVHVCISTWRRLDRFRATDSVASAGQDHVRRSVYASVRLCDGCTCHGGHGLARQARTIDEPTTGRCQCSVAKGPHGVKCLI